MLRHRNQGNLHFHAMMGETNKRDNGSEKVLLTASHCGLENPLSQNLKWERYEE